MPVPVCAVWIRSKVCYWSGDSMREEWIRFALIRLSRTRAIISRCRLPGWNKVPSGVPWPDSWAFVADMSKMLSDILMVIFGWIIDAWMVMPWSMHGDVMVMRCRRFYYSLYLCLPYFSSFSSISSHRYLSFLHPLLYIIIFIIEWYKTVYFSSSYLYAILPPFLYSSNIILYYIILYYIAWPPGRYIDYMNAAGQKPSVFVAQDLDHRRLSRCAIIRTWMMKWLYRCSFWCSFVAVPPSRAGWVQLNRRWSGSLDHL